MSAAKKKRGPGRPKSKVTATRSVRFVLTEDERVELERLAKDAGLGLSAYIRGRLLGHLR